MSENVKMALIFVVGDLLFMAILASWHLYAWHDAYEHNYCTGKQVCI